MRIATWNIRAGGGKRREQIARVILEEEPDVLVLTEFRPVPGRALLELLQSQSYHTAAGTPVGAQNCVCILSRLPMNEVTVENPPMSLHRWVSVHIPGHDLTVLGAHIPNREEKWNKLDFWNAVEAFAAETAAKRSLLIGDLNTALDEDCQGATIREAVYLKRLFAAGWIDAWRHHNPKASEFSWFSHRQNGFRLDHCLASPALAGSIKAAAMRHDVRANRLSDHSLLTVEIDL